MRCAIILTSLLQICLIQLSYGVVPKITRLNVQCDRTGIKVQVDFDVPFNGIIFSKGHYSDLSCRFVNANSSKTSYEFQIPVNSCGTSAMDIDGGEDAMPKRGFENIVVFQNNPVYQEEWDHARMIVCRFSLEEDKKINEKRVVFKPVVVDMLDVITIPMSDSLGLETKVDCWMEITSGRFPNIAPIDGPVKVGSPLTLAIFIRDSRKKTDIRVKDCYAYDDPSAAESNGPPLLQLTDNEGCPIHAKLIEVWKRTTDTGLTGATTIAFTTVSAFKFPDRADLQLSCNVELCRNQCPQRCSRELPAPVSVVWPADGGIGFTAAPTTQKKETDEGDDKKEDAEKEGDKEEDKKDEEEKDDETDEDKKTEDDEKTDEEKDNGDKEDEKKNENENKDDEENTEKEDEKKNNGDEKKDEEEKNENSDDSEESNDTGDEKEEKSDDDSEEKSDDDDNDSSESAKLKVKVKSKDSKQKTSTTPKPIKRTTPKLLRRKSDEIKSTTKPSTSTTTTTTTTTTTARPTRRFFRRRTTTPQPVRRARQPSAQDIVSVQNQLERSQIKSTGRPKLEIPKRNDILKQQKSTTQSPTQIPLTTTKVKDSLVFTSARSTTTTTTTNKPFLPDRRTPIRLPFRSKSNLNNRSNETRTESRPQPPKIDDLPSIRRPPKVINLDNSSESGLFQSYHYQPLRLKRPTVNRTKRSVISYANINHAKLNYGIKVI